MKDALAYARQALLRRVRCTPCKSITQRRLVARRTSARRAPVCDECRTLRGLCGGRAGLLT